MDAKALVKKLGLSKESLERVGQCVKKAEENTSGEIVVALAAESDDYSFWELFSALLVSLALSAVALPFASRLQDLYESLNWSAPEWYLPASYVFASFFLVLVLFVLFNLVLPLDRIVIPRFFKRRAVAERAARAFFEMRISSTRERTGVLIFVSYLEKQVRILADEGIAKKIGPGLWRLIASSLAEEIGKNNAEAALCDAVEKCGSLLAQYFPAGADGNPDELDNGVVILER